MNFKEFICANEILIFTKAMHWILKLDDLTVNVYSEVVLTLSSCKNHANFVICDTPKKKDTNFFGLVIKLLYRSI